MGRHARGCQHACAAASRPSWQDHSVPGVHVPGCSTKHLTRYLFLLSSALLLSLMEFQPGFERSPIKPISLLLFSRPFFLIFPCNPFPSSSAPGGFIEHDKHTQLKTRCSFQLQLTSNWIIQEGVCGCVCSHPESPEAKYHAVISEIIIIIFFCSTSFLIQMLKHIC